MTNPTGTPSRAVRKLPRMGRKRTKDKDLPSRVYMRHGAYYFVDTAGKWHRLADSKPQALRALADLLQTRTNSFSDALAKYRQLIMPRKSPKTQKDQEYQLARLEGVFGRMPISSIRRGHVAQYRDSRPPVAANRELALLSHVFARCMEWELVNDNPCKGIERNTETARDRYVTDDEFDAVFDAAPATVQAIMLMALLIGQREGDLLKLRRTDISEAGISVKQGKTGKKLLIEWTPALRQAVDFAKGLPRTGIASAFLLTTETGQPYSLSGFQTAWQRHIRACHEKGLIAERFTFHDLRAKAATDGPDGRLLGHSDDRLLKRIYQRLPERVQPSR